MIQQQKDQIQKRFEEKLRREEMSKQQSLARNIEHRIMQDNADKDRAVQELKLTKELMAQLLLV